MSRELFWFGVVGVLALLVHFSVVAWWLVPLGWPPLLANVLGFLIAFSVSYWGHRLKTFRAQAVPHRQSLPRFFFVACLGFVLNELLYFILLSFTSLGYRLALLIVLAVVAVVTFVLSRFWAFSKAQL